MLLIPRPLTELSDCHIFLCMLSKIFFYLFLKSLFEKKGERDREHEQGERERVKGKQIPR